MNHQKDKRFDEFLSDSFKDGACIRELRLTNAELKYVQLKFPKSKVTKLPESRNRTPKKLWYEIRIK
ncbi:hypothetical protein [Virgibacillus necropolis]|uniref:Uncharacterized protein n=1 Tax=Virgibacillus necropolis TaxID=163877 RepID=A0A221M8J1_9BACI|nr:hypothetical protein [Virgibacillus necropolis]ASN03950.1 hypothetical protein CFK40_02510 [Virgibacillus necropolis]